MVDDCDLLVATFWTRLGSPTGHAPSGTVEEIERHTRAGKPAMLYFSSAPAHLDSVDEAQYRALREFRSECETRGLIERYESLADLGTKFRRHLARVVLEHFNTATSESEPEAPTIPELSPSAREILMEASVDPHGAVMNVNTHSGRIVQTNGRNFVEGRNARSEAQWEGAIRELEGLNLLEAQGYKREVFRLTQEGYSLADLLRGTT